LDEAISIRPTPLARKRITAMTDSSPRARHDASKGRAPQRIRLRTFVTISSGFCARGNLKRQGQRSTFRGADAKQNYRAIGAGPSNTASSSIGFGLVSKYAVGRAPRKIQPRGPSVCKARRRVSGAVTATQSSKPGSMSSLHATPLSHRRERTRKIVMARGDFANQRDEQAAG